MFKDVADRLRMEWGDRADVRLVVTKDFTMALFHKTKKEHDRNVWKGTGIFKCGELHFVPTESRKSRGLFTAFTEMLAKHRIALAKIADQVSMVSQILTHRSPHMRVLHGPNMPSLVESWDEIDTPWPAILAWYHADGQNLLQGGPTSDTGVWPSIVVLLADLLESIPNPTSPREGTTKAATKQVERRRRSPEQLDVALSAALTRWHKYEDGRFDDWTIMPYGEMCRQTKLPKSTLSNALNRAFATMSGTPYKKYCDAVTNNKTLAKYLIESNGHEMPSRLKYSLREFDGHQKSGQRRHGKNIESDE